MLDKLKLAAKARALQKELKETEVEAKSRDGLITAVISADMKLKSVSIETAYLTADNRDVLEKELVKVIAEGLSKAQAVAAEKAKELMGGLNIPGL